MKQPIKRPFVGKVRRVERDTTTQEENVLFQVSPDAFEIVQLKGSQLAGWSEAAEILLARGETLWVEAGTIDGRPYLEHLLTEDELDEYFAGTRTIDDKRYQQLKLQHIAHTPNAFHETLYYARV